MAAAGTSAGLTVCVGGWVRVCGTEHTLTKNLPHRTTSVVFITQERREVYDHRSKSGI